VAAQVGVVVVGWGRKAVIPEASAIGDHVRKSCRRTEFESEYMIVFSEQLIL
jgi:hypothetical protein